jgi:4-aminobutyrate aminotransferase / (S)-3-amino-2-methylpropionate transaminase / 5-aminovalerate transaminase
MALTGPHIITPVPGPKSQELLKLRGKNVPAGVSVNTPVFVERGEGALVEDIDGNVFLDFVGGIGVLNVGYSHPEVIDAVKEQVDKFFHTSINVLLYENYMRVAEHMNNLLPGNFAKKTMLVNSGAEAVENAIKIARKYTGRSEIIVFTGAFHGRTNLTMAMTSKVKPYKFEFGPFAPGIHRMPYPYCYRCPYGLEETSCGLYCAEQIESFFLEVVAPSDVAAVVIEPIQGEGGFVVPPDAYISVLRDICDTHGILLIADEIQTSFGRTGKLFATEHWQAAADMVTTAKSIAGGLPISTVTGRSEIMDAAHVGGIGGTYSGNPVAAAAAMKVIEIMQRDDYPGRANELGDYFRGKLNQLKEKHQLIGDVRGRGVMLAIELVKDRSTKAPAKDETNAIIQECWKNGLVLLSAGARGNVIRFLVPLVVTEAQIDTGLMILDQAIGKVMEEFA